MGLTVICKKQHLLPCLCKTALVNLSSGQSRYLFEKRRRRENEKERLIDELAALLPVRQWKFLWPLCRWSFSLFWQPHTGVFACYKYHNTRALKHLAPVITALTQLCHHRRIHARTHTHTTVSVCPWCVLPLHFSSFSTRVSGKGPFYFQLRPGAESISPRKISMTRSSEDICPLKASVAVWTAVRAHRASQTFPDKTEASLGGKIDRRKTLSGQKETSTGNDTQGRWEEASYLHGKLWEELQHLITCAQNWRKNINFLYFEYLCLKSLSWMSWQFTKHTQAWGELVNSTQKVISMIQKT